MVKNDKVESRTSALNPDHASDAKLDAKDKKILSMLDMDARLPVTIIAKKTGLSREVADYRIKQLEKKGIIEGYYTAIDITKLGLMYCRMFFRFRKMTSEKQKEFNKYCSSNPHITWLIYGEGMFDVAVTVVAKDLETIEAVNGDLHLKFGEFLQNPYLSFAFRIYHYKHNYLYGTNDDKELILGEPSKHRLEVDKTDYQIIDALNEEPLMSLIALAEKIGSTPKSIAYRIKKLVENRIIIGFRAKINTRKLGYDRYKVFLTLQDFGKDQQHKLKSYLRHHPNVIYVTKPMGMHNLEFEIMVRNANHLHEIMIELKDIFADILVSYQTNLYYSEPILTYCPIEKQLL